MTTTIPPVVLTVEVSLASQEAFELFTRGMSTWWPLETHSIAVDSLEGAVTAERVVFEGREGGRIYEVMSDGAEAAWGSVLVWDPPARVVFSWRPALTEGPHTEVEVRFIPSGAGTTVELTHRAWERLGEGGAALRDRYSSGWVGVMERFRARTL